jgi:hypothetical protein
MGEVFRSRDTRVEGQTVRDPLAGGAPSARKAAELGAQVAHGLAAAHEKGILHRDVYAGPPTRWAPRPAAFLRLRNRDGPLRGPIRLARSSRAHLPVPLWAVVAGLAVSISVSLGFGVWLVEAYGA